LPPAGYRFGPFSVDRAGYRVLDGDQPVDLTPKLLDLLLHLLDHAGELVTKEALLEALWPEANVTDNALTQAVSELRQALGDDAAAPQYIKTIARRGYRFVAPVTAIGETPRAAENADAAGERAIAVLDFTNMTGDPESAWLSAGIAETVSGDLRALGAFRVVDRWRVSEAVRRTGGGLQDVAAALQVRLAAIGSFQRNGGRVRITARVVDVVSGEALADAKVDGRLDDIFALQDEVAAQFAAELGLVTSASRAPARRETPSLEAYRAVMEGWLRVESLDVRELPNAVADFERAVTIDPRYALAYNGLANAEFASYEATRADDIPAQDLLERAVAHGRQAVQLDDSLAEAHGTLALILVSAREPAAAIKAARRAVSLEPGNWRHLFRLGHASWGEERLRAGAATLALYPDFAFAYFQSAMVHVARGQLTEAERVLRHGAAIQDRQIGRGERYPALGLHWLLGLVRLALDDTREAIDEFDRERAVAAPHRLYGREYSMHAHLGHGAALLRLGRRGEAARSFRAAQAHYPQQPLAAAGLAIAERTPFDPAAIRDPLSRGLAYAALERPDEAASVLAEAIEQAPPGFTGWALPAEPFLLQVSDNKYVNAVLKTLADRAR